MAYAQERVKLKKKKKFNFFVETVSARNACTRLVVRYQGPKKFVMLHELNKEQKYLM